MRIMRQLALPVVVMVAGFGVYASAQTKKPAAKKTARKGSASSSPMPAGGMYGVAEPVNTGTGSYEYSHTDLSLAGRTPLIFSRSYNSRTAAGSPA